MSATGPVGRVVTLLAREGYSEVQQPRSIGGIPFEFAAMLAGRNSLDLIAVVDLAVDPDDERIRSRVEGLARALDLVRSRRSLTVVLVGPRRGAGLIQAIAGVARVLSAGSPREEDEAELRNALAVLLPLEVSAEDDDSTQSWAATRARLVATYPPETEAALSAARSGRSAVEGALRELLAGPIEDFYASTNDHQEDEA